MKTLCRCLFVLALVLLTVPAAQAADHATDLEVVQSVPVDAPVVETLPPNEQPLFASLALGQAPINQAACLDSGIRCSTSADCAGKCGRYTCTCADSGGAYRTCVLCP